MLSTSCDVMFARHVLVENSRLEKAYTQSDSTGDSADLTSRRIVKLNHRGAEHWSGGMECDMDD